MIDWKTTSTQTVESINNKLNIYYKIQQQSTNK